MPVFTETVGFNLINSIKEFNEYNTKIYSNDKIFLKA